MHLLASHCRLAANHPSEIRLGLFKAEVYSRSMTASALVSRARLVCGSASILLGMLQ